MIVLGAAAGDAHGLPTALMTDLLSDLRFEVIDLGANTPPESFVEVCAGCDDLVGVGICVVLDEQVDSALDQARELRDALPNTFLLLGGSVFSRIDGGVFDVPVDAISTTAQEACDAFERAADATAMAGAQ